MKQETNNEMDLLLRRLGRRQDAGTSGEHLDADELSLYAENVLPAAARARYTEHLAECARCRDIVVQLSSAAGVVAVAETSSAPEPSGLRKFLAGLFSPMVLRYAAPALGLIIVAAIGVVVLRRQNRPADSVAQLQEASRPIFSITQPQPTASAETDKNVVNKVESPAATGPQQRETSKETAAQPAPVPNAPPTVSSVTAENRQPTNEKKAADEEMAKEPAPPPKAAPPAATPADEPRAKVDDVAQKRETETRMQKYEEKSADKLARGGSEDRKSAEVAAARAPARNKAGSLRVVEPAAVAGTAGRRDAEQQKDKDDADVRSVAGRRFRKERGIWIDTAYDSSQSTTNITRGSEQYRSLIGDEPQIKTIADQLDGEIIVVWKGRPYRIR